MAKVARKPSLDQALDVLEKLHGPALLAPRAEDPIIDHLVVAVLGRHAGLEKAREAVHALSDAFLDMNEVRVSPLYELEEVLKPFVPAGTSRAAAWDVRMALQDVYDTTHGLDLEPLRGRDPEDQRVFVKDLPNTPGGPAAIVFQVGLGEARLALGPRESHLLDRLGMLPRAGSPDRVRAAVERQVKPGQRMRFTWLTGASAHLFEKGELDPDHPFCQLLVATNARELVERERERKKEEARQKADEKRREQEEARRKKKEEAEAKKREKEEARRKAADAKKAAAAAAKAKAAAAAAAKKAKAKAAARSKAAAKKPAAKKPAPPKPAPRKAAAKPKAAPKSPKATAKKKPAAKKGPPRRTKG
jgi:hypothetical protein